MKSRLNGIYKLVLVAALVLQGAAAAGAAPLAAATAGDFAQPAAAILVDSSADSATPGDSACTLREAIANANGNSDSSGGDCTAGSGADVITFDATIHGAVITLGGAPLNISSDLTISGPALGITIDGNNASTVFTIAGGAVEISNLTITHGSGISGGIINSGQLTIKNSALTDNYSSDYGDAVYNNEFSSLTLINSTISGNTAANGGAIADTNSFISIQHTTIYSNTTQSAGGGGGLDLYGPDSHTQIKNSILAGNINAGGANNVVKGDNATLTSLGYNLESGAEAGFLSAGDLQNSDPGLLPLANNGGPTHTHALITLSPLRNHIPNGASGCGVAYTNDQRGIVRPFEGACDPGAYEFTNPTIYIDINNAHANPAGNWNTINDTGGDVTVNNLIDAYSGQATDIFYRDHDWTDITVEESAWIAGDKDWVLDNAADDGFSVDHGVATITFGGLTGSSYRLDLVSAFEIAGDVADFTVAGAFADCNDNNTPGVNGDNFDAKTDGRDLGNWLIWDDLAPVGGAITVTVDSSGPGGTFGDVNALRLMEDGPQCPKTILLDFYDWEPNPGGNWNVAPFIGANLTNLIDAEDGLPTGVSYSSSGWDGYNRGDITWIAGNKAWLLDDAADDGFFTIGTANIIFSGLTGSDYRLELVSSSTLSDFGDYTIAGAFADCNVNRTPGVSGDNFNAKTDGRDAGNWLIWDEIAPLGGAITITIDASGAGLTGGGANAIRLVENGPKCPNTILVDLNNALPNPGGTWNTINQTDANNTVAGLVDAVSGLPTAVSYSGDSWEYILGFESVWIAGDKDWLLDAAADDGFSTVGPATITFSGLAGSSYRLEFVSAFQDSGDVADYTVGGSFADCSFNRTPGVNGDDYDAQIDGRNPGNWLIWENLIPEGGVITVDVDAGGSFGDVNAIRLVESAPYYCNNIFLPLVVR